MNNNRLIKEIEYLKHKEEIKYEKYLQLYKDTFNQYKIYDEALLNMKIIPIWRYVIKSKYRLDAFTEILNNIYLFHNGKINYEICDTMINCDECQNCELQEEYLEKINKYFKDNKE